MPRNYCDRQQLAEMVTESQLIGGPTPELIAVVRQIARGLVLRLRFAIDADDAQQAAIVKLYRVLPRMDVRRNCFSYLTTVIGNEMRAIWGQEAKQRAIAEQVAREQGWRPGHQSTPDA